MNCINIIYYRTLQVFLHYTGPTVSNSDITKSHLGVFVVLRKINSRFYSHYFCYNCLWEISFLGQCVSCYPAILSEASHQSFLVDCSSKTVLQFPCWLKMMLARCIVAANWLGKNKTKINPFPNRNWLTWTQHPSAMFPSDSRANFKRAFVAEKEKKRKCCFHQSVWSEYTRLRQAYYVSSWRYIWL